jgi:hypothetical protein
MTTQQKKVISRETAILNINAKHKKIRYKKEKLVALFISISIIIIISNVLISYFEQDNVRRFNSIKTLAPKKNETKAISEKVQKKGGKDLSGNSEINDSSSVQYPKEITRFIEPLEVVDNPKKHDGHNQVGTTNDLVSANEESVSDFLDYFLTKGIYVENDKKFETRLRRIINLLESNFPEKGSYDYLLLCSSKDYLLKEMDHLNIKSKSLRENLKNKCH